MNAADARLYPLLVVSLSLGFIASGAALLLWMLATTIGPFHFLDSRVARTGPVALWLPSEALPGAEGRVQAWRALWREIDATGPLPESRSLDALLHAETPLLLVPDARAATVAELEQLERYVRAGGAVLVTGGIAVQDEDGSPRGSEDMRDLLSVPAAQILPASATRALHAGVRGPLNRALPPHQSLRLRAQEGLFALEEPESELRWDVSGDAAASRRREIGAGRLVWLAAGPEHRNLRDPADRRALRDTLAQAIGWARRAPTLSLLPWPDGSTFAGHVALDERGEGRSTDGLQEALLEELEAARRRAEHAELAVPVPSLGEYDARALAREVDRELKRRGAWIATSGEVDDWTRARSQIAAAVEPVGPSRLLVRVSNRGAATIRRIGLRVALNRPISALSMSATTLGQDVPEIRHRPGAEAADFVVAELGPGKSLALTIDYRLSTATGIAEFSPGANDPH